MIKATSYPVISSAKNLKKNILHLGNWSSCFAGKNLELYKGGMAILLGPYGIGKSTLLNIVGSLHNPSSGEVFYKEHNLVTASLEELTLLWREHVGFFFRFITSFHVSRQKKCNVGNVNSSLSFIFDECLRVSWTSRERPSFSVSTFTWRTTTNCHLTSSSKTSWYSFMWWAHRDAR